MNKPNYTIQQRPILGGLTFTLICAIVFPSRSHPVNETEEVSITPTPLPRSLHGVEDIAMIHMSHLGRVKYFKSGTKGQEGTGFGFIEDLGQDGKTPGAEYFFHISDVWNAVADWNGTSGLVQHTKTNWEVPFIPQAGQMVSFKPEVRGRLENGKPNYVAECIADAARYKLALLDSKAGGSGWSIHGEEEIFAWVTHFPLKVQHDTPKEWEILTSCVFKMLETLSSLYTAFDLSSPFPLTCIHYCNAMNEANRGNQEKAYRLMRKALHRATDQLSALSKTQQ
jgi:cold shock CspA family protein